MPRISDTPGHDSTGKKPYVRRPRKTTAKKTTAKKSTARAPLAEAVGDLDADRRSTAAERRRVIVEALRVSSAIATDPGMPPSARTQALNQVKSLSEQLRLIDAEDPEQPPGSLLDRRPRAI